MNGMNPQDRDKMKRKKNKNLKLKPNNDLEAISPKFSWHRQDFENMPDIYSYF